MHYPHSDSSWPAAAEELEDVTIGVPHDEIDRITFENACRWYRFDPFGHRTRDRCTVAAPRAEASDHDVSIRSYDQGRYERAVGVGIADLTAKPR